MAFLILALLVQGVEVPGDSLNGIRIHLCAIL